MIRNRISEDRSHDSQQLIPRLDRDTTRELGIEVHAGASTTKRQTYLPSNIHVIPYPARGCSIDEFPQSWSQRCCLIFRYIKHLRRNRMNRWPAYMTEVPSIAWVTCAAREEAHLMAPVCLVLWLDGRDAACRFWFSVNSTRAGSCAWVVEHSTDGALSIIHWQTSEAHWVTPGGFHTKEYLGT